MNETDTIEQLLHTSRNINHEKNGNQRYVSMSTYVFVIVEEGL